MPTEKDDTLDSFAWAGLPRPRWEHTGGGIYCWIAGPVVVGPYDLNCERTDDTVIVSLDNDDPRWPAGYVELMTTGAIGVTVRGLLVVAFMAGLIR